MNGPEHYPTMAPDRQEWCDVYLRSTDDWQANQQTLKTREIPPTGDTRKVYSLISLAARVVGTRVTLEALARVPRDVTEIIQRYTHWSNQLGVFNPVRAWHVNGRLAWETHVAARAKKTKSPERHKRPAIPLYYFTLQSRPAPLGLCKSVLPRMNTRDWARAWTPPAVKDYALHGTHRGWDANGRLTVECAYEGNLKHGLCRVWYDGIIGHECTYNRGIRMGRVRSWRPSGRNIECSEYTYDNSSPDGPWRKYCAYTGMCLEDYYNRDGNCVGMKRCWNRNGFLTGIMSFTGWNIHHGLMVNTIYGVPPGQAIVEIYYEDKRLQSARVPWVPLRTGFIDPDVIVDLECAARKYGALPPLPPLPSHYLTDESVIRDIVDMPGGDPRTWKITGPVIPESPRPPPRAPLTETSSSSDDSSSDYSDSDYSDSDDY